MPNILPELNPELGYIYCPACQMNGTPNIMMKRDQHQLKCPYGHTMDAAPKNADEMEQRKAIGASMVGMGELMKESPSITSVKWPIWVHPKVREALERKFPQNLWHTLETMMAALADGSVIFITGPEAIKLRAHGITNGVSALAMAEAMDQAEKDRIAAIKRLNELQDMLKAAGV